ncbi:IS66 family transposase [Thorsellia kenyensis]|uniref:IS66 family transposase n=1 Tax=Thorsellia kenyensis TaxID=1549888 RepID=A0ABV6C891_9GAMM
MTAIGEAISEKVDFILAKIIVIRTKRIKYTCTCCQTLVAALMPAEIIDKGIPTDNLLTEIVAKKFIYHLPLYRQQQLFKTMGVDFSLSTLSDWVAAVGNALAPLAERLKTLLLEQEVIHADETRLNILDNRRGSSIIHGYIWAYASSIHSNVPIIYYDCTDSREGKHAQNILKTFKGKLVVDDYSGYKALFDKYESIIEAGCFTHVRRKFAEIVKVAPHPLAQYFINESAKLYQIENKLKHVTPEQRKHVRKKFAKPILKKLRKWLIKTLSKTLPNTLFARALNHAINRWKSLEIYLNDGNVPIDNNHIERNIRPIALGRKNWLFAGSFAASQLMTNIMSLLATARANGIDPEQWLRETLAVLPTWKYNELDKLLPIKSIQKTECEKNSTSIKPIILYRSGQHR